MPTSKKLAAFCSQSTAFTFLVQSPAREGHDQAPVALRKGVKSGIDKNRTLCQHRMREGYMVTED